METTSVPGTSAAPGAIPWKSGQLENKVSETFQGVIWT